MGWFNGWFGESGDIARLERQFHEAAIRGDELLREVKALRLRVEFLESDVARLQQAIQPPSVPDTPTRRPRQPRKARTGA